MTTRRNFLKTSALAASYIGAANIVSAQTGVTQKLRVCKVGTGGIGVIDIKQMLDSGKVVFTALCDTNPGNLAQAQQKFPNAVCSTDWRKLFEKHADKFDAVVISTPDHTHAIIALDAMRLGKHVYVQKPLAHSFEECEMLLAAARRYKVVTQMGNQGHPGAQRYARLWEKKLWGDILEVHSWTDRAGGKWWPQGMKELPKSAPVPNGFNWDCWLGPQAMRDYSPAYQPFRWRGWRDFGCGAIGDMAVHNFDPAYWLLADRTLPKRITCWADDNSAYAFPRFSTIDMRFGATSKCPKGFNFYWYESRILPKPPPGSNLKLTMPENGVMVVGSRAATVGGTHAATPTVVAATGKPFGNAARELNRELKTALTVPEGEKVPWAYSHYHEWVDAAIANKPEQCGSRFEYAVPFTQALIFGCIAQAFPGEELLWNNETREFNKPEATAMLKAPSREGFVLRV